MATILFERGFVTFQTTILVGALLVLYSFLTNKLGNWLIDEVQQYKKILNFTTNIVVFVPLLFFLQTPNIVLYMVGYIFYLLDTTYKDYFFVILLATILFEFRLLTTLFTPLLVLLHYVQESCEPNLRQFALFFTALAIFYISASMNFTLF